jgi:hypothetical protein
MGATTASTIWRAEKKKEKLFSPGGPEESGQRLVVGG